MSTDVFIIGPNLRGKDERKGTFHIHEAGCADIDRTLRRNGMDNQGGWGTAGSTKAEIGAEVYGDMISEGSMTVEDALDDIWFAPCTAALR